MLLINLQKKIYYDSFWTCSQTLLLMVWKNLMYSGSYCRAVAFILGEKKRDEGDEGEVNVNDLR